MRVTWISGWGVAPESLRPIASTYFPGSEHTFHTPTSITASRASAGADVTIAWSLGAWHVIDAASRGVALPGMVLLLAPFVAFPSESHLGGKCSATQVKFLRRWLQREPLGAIADFYRRAGLSQPLTQPAATVSPPDGGRDEAGGESGKAELPYALPALLEGLDRLAEDAPPALREFAARGIPRNWQAFVGDNDPLLDGAAVCRALPGCTLLRGAGHDIADLLRASQAK